MCSLQAVIGVRIQLSAMIMLIEDANEETYIIWLLDFDFRLRYMISSY